MTPTEARALSKRMADNAALPIPSVWACRDAAAAIHSLADQVEALEGEALSSVEREEYFAMKRDADRYRWLRTNIGKAVIETTEWNPDGTKYVSRLFLSHGLADVDAASLDEAIDRAREET